MGLIPLLFQMLSAKNAFSEGSELFIKKNPEAITRLDNAKNIQEIVAVAEELSEKAKESFYSNYLSPDYLLKKYSYYICLYLDVFVRDYYSRALRKGTKNEIANESLAVFADYVQNEVNKKLEILVSCEKVSSIGKAKSFPFYICNLAEYLRVDVHEANVGASFHGMIYVIKDYVDKMVKNNK